MVDEADIQTPLHEGGEIKLIVLDWWGDGGLGRWKRVLRHGHRWGGLGHRQHRRRNLMIKWKGLEGGKSQIKDILHKRENESCFVPNFIVHSDLVVLFPQYPEGDVVVGGEG